LAGMVVVATAVMCFAGLAAAAMMQGVWPSLLDMINQKMWIFGAASAGLAAVAMVVGFMLGKKSEG